MDLAHQKRNRAECEGSFEVEEYISESFNARQQGFLDFVLQHYVSVGVEELDQEKLTPLLRLKYHDSLADAVADLGAPELIGQVFAGFRRFSTSRGPHDAA